MASKYYKSFNPNPLNKTTGDCVVRAICAVTGLSWYEVFDKASAYARANACLLNSGVPEEQIGMLKDVFNITAIKMQKREKGKRALYVAKFCKEHPTGRYILKLAHHLIGIVDGEYYDLYAGWDDSTVYKIYECKE